MSGNMKVIEVEPKVTILDGDAVLGRIEVRLDVATFIPHAHEAFFARQLNLGHLDFIREQMVAFADKHKVMLK